MTSTDSHAGVARSAGERRGPGRGVRRALLACCVLLCCSVLFVGSAAAGGAADRAVAVEATGSHAGTPAATAQADCFGSDVFEAPAGSVATIDVQCGEYVLIGADRRPEDSAKTNFVDILYVSGGGTVEVNTRLAGTNSTDVYSGAVSYTQKYGLNTPPNGTSEFSDVEFVDEDGNEIATTLGEFREELGITSPSRPLQPKRYRLVAGTGGTFEVGEDGIPYPANATGRSNLKLTRPSFEGDLETDIAPAGNADGDFAPSTDRNEVARGDRVRISGFDTSGIEGTLETIDADESDEFLRELNGTPGVTVTFEHLNPGPNEDPETIEFSGASDDELYVDPQDRTGGEFELVVDTSPGSWFDEYARPGDEFRVTFAFESNESGRFQFDHGGTGPPDPFDTGGNQYPYYGLDDTTVESTTTFTVVEPRLEYDRLTDDDELIVRDSGTDSITGTTTYAPGTDLGLQFISEDGPPPTVIDINDVVILDDGTFTVETEDVSELEGNKVEAELFLDNELYDRRPVVLARDPDSPAVFEIRNATSPATTTAGGSLSELAVTVENTGVSAGSRTLELRVDGNVLAERTVSVEDGRARTFTFDRTYPLLSAGEYQYTVGIPAENEAAEGQLRIEERTTPTPEPTPEPTTAPETTVATTTQLPTTASPITTAAGETPTPDPARNESGAGGDDPDRSIPGLVLWYLGSVAPYTLGSMLFVIVAWAVLRQTVARRGKGSSS